METNNIAMINQINQINQLHNVKHLINKEITHCENKINKYKYHIIQIEKTIMNICNHNWQFDDCYGIGDLPDYICKLCNSRIIR
jgi:hypothetical protein